MAMFCCTRTEWYGKAKNNRDETGVRTLASSDTIDHVQRELLERGNRISGCARQNCRVPGRKRGPTNIAP